MSLPPATFHVGAAESADRYAIAPALSEPEAARVSGSAFAGAAEISAGWFFSIAPLNMPGPPNALLPRVLDRSAGALAGECNPRVCAVDCMNLQTVQPGWSGAGGGVIRRTFDLSAAFAGRSAKIVILLFAVLKALLIAPGCGCGAGGTLLPWPFTTIWS